MKTARKVYNYWLEFESQDEKKMCVPRVEIEHTDNDRLINLQWAFLVNSDKQAFAKLWQSFTTLCRKIVKKETKSKRFFLDKDEAEYKAQVASEYVMRRYKMYEIEKNEIYIVTNFIASAYHAVQHALYSDTENDFFLEKCKALNGKKINYPPEII